MGEIANKIHKKYPHLKAAYRRNIAYWAWACIYTVNIGSILTVGEINKLVKASEGYAGGRPAY